MNRKLLFRKKALAGAASLMALVIAGAAGAEEARAAMLDIEAQPLAKALLEFNKQTGVIVIANQALLDGKTAPAIRGEIAPDKALEKILLGSGLKSSELPSGAYTITLAEAEVRDDRPFRLAQVDQESSRRVETIEKEVAEEDKKDEVTVVGSRIRGIQNSTAPVVVLDKEFIDATGLTTTIQVIESLPQNFALVNQSATGGGLSGNSFSSTQGASISLRGIGEGTTLTLVNGRRMPLGYDGSAVNIAAIPLSAIERVEVLTDGASALYGSDAVGGVVNFVLRKDFDGAETRGRLGYADSVDEHRFSQTMGRSWDSGSFVISAEHYRRDILLASDRDFSVGGVKTLVPSLSPEENNYALSAFARQDVTEKLEAFVDVIYSKRDSFNKSFQITTTSNANLFVDNSQLSVTGGLGYALGEDWRVELSGSYGADDLNVDLIDPLAVFPLVQTPNKYQIAGVDLKADGPIFEIPGGAVSLAVGGHWREEKHDYEQISSNAAGAVLATIPFNKDRRVGSLFAEAFIPIIGEGNAAPWVERLELSLAGRYDDYSDFGSSFDPRIGLAWTPGGGLKLRGAWGTSYVAPKTRDFDLAFNSAVAIQSYFLADFLNILAVNGNAPESLKPQESENWSFGLDFEPEFLPGASFAVNYYNIDYRNKIESTAQFLPSTMLADPAAYGALFILGPTVAQVNEYIGFGLLGQGFFALNADFTPDTDFDPASVEIIFDVRRRNLGVVKTSGVDVSTSYDFDLGGGEARLGFDAAYIIEMLKQITATSTAFDVVDTFANPTRLRLRGQIGYRHGGWSFNSFIHHKNSYTDNRFAPFMEMDSYTTVDANIAYRFGEGRGDIFSNVTVALGVTNLFDQAPPLARARGAGFAADLGFDPANASPLGRLVTIDLTVLW